MTHYFSAEELQLLSLDASVPDDAPYGAKHILDISNLSLNQGQITGIADDALHVVNYLGDTTGSGDYTSLDGQYILRQVLRQDSGFASALNVDPLIIGDITGNGRISALDASRILQQIGEIEQPDIPPVPSLRLIDPRALSGSIQ